MNSVMNSLRRRGSSALLQKAAKVQTTRNFSAQRKKAEGGLNSMYQMFFKNNTVYVTYIICGAVVAEVVYGKLTDYVWEANNRGRLYHHIDWSQFKFELDEDDEEEEEEAEEEEEEDDDDE